jgi:hypothetical protein
MTITVEMSEKIVDRIVGAHSSGWDDIPAMFKRLKDQFPEATEDDIMEAFQDAAKELEDHAASNKREADALRDLRPLFEGFPPGTPLGECARVKAELGDPLALAFLEWEKTQAGGVQ